MSAITLQGDAIQFVGQDLAGWEIEHLGVDDAGNPVRQARQKFPGGEQIAQQGDWIVTLASGQQVIVHVLPSVTEPEISSAAQAKIDRLQARIDALTPEVEASTQAKIDGLQAKIDALKAEEAAVVNPDPPAAGDQSDVQEAAVEAAPTEPNEGQG